MEKVVVLGASPNPERYSYKAVQSLQRHGFDVIAVGNRTGLIGNVNIISELKDFGNIHSVSLYLNAGRQEEWKETILSWKPKRVIFNPGTENADFALLLRKSGIATEEACTLVLLSTNQFITG